MSDEFVLSERVVQTPPITAAEIAASVTRDVAELSGRTSPEDWPEPMLVTNEELRRIVEGRVAPALAQRDEWLSNTNSAADQEAARYLGEIRQLEEKVATYSFAQDIVNRFDQSGAQNWCGWVVPYRDGQIEVTMQIVGGKSTTERLSELTALLAAADAPVPIIIHCPKCHLQHIDVDDETGAWATTRHHKKHLCKPEDGGCGNVWAPANRYTVGVLELPEVRA